MNEEATFLTREGYKKLQEELVYMRKTRRQEVARRLHQALTEGDILENAELEDARNEQAFVEGRILTLENMLGSAVIIEDEEHPQGIVSLGSKVTVVEGEDGVPETYVVVGSAEADPANGHISNESPLGRALMGRQVGEQAEVDAPDGLLVFEILGIQ
jgi:transcription elongation factor GreA